MFTFVSCIETSSLLPRSRPDSVVGGPQYKPPGSGDHWGRGSGLDQAPDAQNAQALRPGRGIPCHIALFHVVHLQLFGHNKVHKLTNYASK